MAAAADYQSLPAWITQLPLACALYNLTTLREYLLQSVPLDMSRNAHNLYTYFVSQAAAPLRKNFIDRLVDLVNPSLLEESSPIVNPTWQEFILNLQATIAQQSDDETVTPLSIFISKLMVRVCFPDEYGPSKTKRTVAADLNVELPEIAATSTDTAAAATPLSQLYKCDWQFLTNEPGSLQVMLTVSNITNLHTVQQNLKNLTYWLEPQCISDNLQRLTPTQLSILATAVATVKSLLKVLNRLDVLIVDDAQTCRMTAAQCMRQNFECKITFAENGAEAVAKVRNRLEDGKKFDLILMDVEMEPGKNGIAATREIRQAEATLKIPQQSIRQPIVVISTSLGCYGQQALDAGADETLPKPITSHKEQLLLIINKLTGRLPRTASPSASPTASTNKIAPAQAEGAATTATAENPIPTPRSLLFAQPKQLDLTTIQTQLPAWLLLIQGAIATRSMTPLTLS